jgi:putative iron-dependent peroxidase
MDHQSGIVAPVPTRGRNLQLKARPGGEIRPALERLSRMTWGDELVIGFGPSVFATLGVQLGKLRQFPVFHEALVDVPITPAAIWLWVRGEDPGVLVEKSKEVASLLTPEFFVVEAIDTFKYREGRDLSGYIDGTENPPEEKVPAVTFASGEGTGRDGGAYVSVQRWAHDLTLFESWTQDERDNAIGRRRSDNKELTDAPRTAHVKRTAQESFDPEAFVLRRSMPYTLGKEEGLMFVAFGASLDPFEAQLKRMVGAEDGLVDALFRFSTPVTGAQFFCPPMLGDHLDLSALLVSP